MELILSSYYLSKTTKFITAIKLKYFIYLCNLLLAVFQMIFYSAHQIKFKKVFRKILLDGFLILCPKVAAAEPDVR